MAELRVVATPPGTPLAALMDDYLASCRARGLSPKTIRDNYGYALKHVFLPWANEAGITEPAQVTNRVLDRFTSHLLEHGGKRGPLSRQSAAGFVELVNWWLRWLTKEGELAAATRAQVPAGRSESSTSSAATRFSRWRMPRCRSATS